MTETKNSPFQYKTPQILAFDYHANPDFPEKKWTIRINHQKEIIRMSQNQARVTLYMEISNDGEEELFSVKFSVSSTFVWGSISEEIINSLLNRTAPSLLLGYVRPLVAMFTNSSGMGSYNIPLIDFTNDPILDTKYDKG